MHQLFTTYLLVTIFFQMSSIKSEENPWNVQSLYDLQYFNCPSCAYKNKSKQKFVSHAYQFHPAEAQHLTDIKDDSMSGINIPIDDDVEVKIKHEQFDYDDNDIIEEPDHPSPLVDDQKSFVTHVVEDYHPIKIDTFTEDQKDNNEEDKLSSLLLSGNISVIRAPKQITSHGKKRLMKSGGGGPKNIAVKASKISSVYNGHKCDTCGKIFSHGITLKRHVHSVHEGHENYNCDSYCNQISDAQAKIISKKSEKKIIKCDKCSKIFTRKEAIKKHIQSVHEGERNFKCELCGKLFSAAQNLKRHQHLVHEGRRDFICDTCGKALAEKNDLKKHIAAVHDKIYKCETCDPFRLFSSANALKTHIYTVHEGHRDFTCDTCGKSFSQPQRLKRHFRSVHLGEKNFPCHICGRAFADPYKVKIHVQGVHEGIRGIPRKRHKQTVV